MEPKPVSFALENTKIRQRIVRMYINRMVLVELRGKRKVKGLLRGYDENLNLVLKPAFEILKNKSTDGLGIVVILGGSILSLRSDDAASD